ncbi:Hypothetical protein NTJ_08823 [Nesidiocoris tenuis]|uniref:Lipid-binding serum glycoprotein C-terminal domain-containing protein n=1 Tax=Nesidiocoris tenuis TaxID=355587 RepID=A0ABN7AV02_9HEMI|nr:Hypothetical protein NTJ_08823 [Nesidiocoris tenuis]
MQCSQTDSPSWVANLLTELSVVLKDGVPAMGIPNFDPLPISKAISVNSSMFSGNIVVDGELSGFSNYAVGNARLDPDLYTELDIAFVSTKFEGGYALQATAYDGIVPLSGSGPITIYLSFIEIVANGTIVGKNQMLQLKDFDLRLKDINFVQVKAGGLLKDYGLDEVLEPSLEGLINTGIKLFKNDIQSYINKFIMTDGNLMLREEEEGLSVTIYFTMRIITPNSLHNDTLLSSLLMEPLVLPLLEPFFFASICLTSLLNFRNAA